MFKPGITKLGKNTFILDSNMKPIEPSQTSFVVLKFFDDDYTIEQMTTEQLQTFINSKN